MYMHVRVYARQVYGGLAAVDGWIPTYAKTLFIEHCPYLYGYRSSCLNSITFFLEPYRFGQLICQSVADDPNAIGL